MTINNPAYKTWLGSVVNPYEAITVLEKSEVSNVDLSDIADALDEYVRLFKAEIASPAEILTLSRAYPDEEKYSLAVIDKELDQNEPVVIGGPASVEVVDREGHLITLAAMKRAFERFMANFRTRNAMVLHSDVQVGWALPAYISKTGKIYKSGVTGDHLFFITELRDDTKIAKKVLEQIDTGKMKSYSIAGSATSVEAVQNASGMIMQVNDMELAEVTICEQGVNQKAKFELMKSDADRPTSSCVDGSCLIKSQSHVHSKTELFVNDDGIIDTVGSFSNWVQKAGLYANIHARRKSGKRMRSEGDPKAPTDADFMDAGRVKKGVGMAMQKSSLEQLDDHLEKGIGDIARGAGKAVGAAVEGAKNVGSALKEGYKTPKVNDEGIITNLSPREAARRFKPVPMTERLAAHREKIIAQRDSKNMQKSHLEGCGCASCMQRTGDDDTARTATDRNGRPTLGHTGQGNAVAIIISRMHRKAEEKAKQLRLYPQPSSKETGSPPLSRLQSTGGDDFVDPHTGEEFDINDLPKDQYEEAAWNAKPKQKDVQKAVYEFIDKARTKEQQRKGQLGVANQARSKAFSGFELPDLAGNANPELKENLKRRDRSTIKFGQRQNAYDATRTPAGRRRQSYESGKEANAEIARMEMNTLGYNTKDVQKAVYEYINKAFTPPSREEQKEAADKRSAAALANAKERYGEDFTPAKPKVRPYRGSAPRPQQTGGERKDDAQAKWRENNPGKEDPPSFKANMQKAVYAYLHKNNIEKGALGAIGKVVGGAAKVGAKVAGGALGVAEGLIGSEGGRSVLGNVARVAGDAAGESKSNTPRMPSMELDMAKQAPEWSTPQTETPLHKFIDHNKKDQD